MVNVVRWVFLSLCLVGGVVEARPESLNTWSVQRNGRTCSILYAAENRNFAITNDEGNYVVKIGFGDRKGISRKGNRVDIVLGSKFYQPYNLISGNFAVSGDGGSFLTRLTPEEWTKVLDKLYVGNDVTVIIKGYKPWNFSLSGFLDSYREFYKCFDQKKGDAVSGVDSGASKPPSRVNLLGPEQEPKFVNINAQFREKYKTESNDLLKSTMFEKRRGELTGFGKGSVAHWTGTVSEVKAVGLGPYWASLTVDVGSGVKIGSGGLLDSPKATFAAPDTLEAVPVDVSLISPKSTLYETLLELKIGQTIEFSGNFYPSEAGGILDMNLLEENSILTPFYRFKFETITPK
ncbi:hypothetical protein [Mesorhizobium sp. CA7]|uniref:hypothetical protein n=1 Tax=Mesorhizobium sp. CA7 TaxID=588501 RepID=UPI001CC9A66A|nr:hypothetical protein [Mesorhizobium sp. CA7]MBZ9812471.1 hypothetical protein [Mesorhizobium sp. CA7]